MGFYNELASDARYGLRQLQRNAGFASVAVITLTLATGANTAIFSVVDTVLFRSLPFRDSSRLVSVTERYRIPRIGALGPDFAAWREHNRVFEELAGFGGAGSTSNLTGIGEPLTVGVREVTTNLFPTLGVRPILGRNFVAEEGRQGRDNVAILAEELWRTRFGANPQTLGQTISLDGMPYIVVGVMPRTLRYPESDIWEPMTIDQRFSAASRGWALVTSIARLRPGTSIDQAQANLQVITTQLAPEYSPQAQQTVANARVEIAPLQAKLSQNARPLLLFLFGTVGFVLLIACANVANLLLSRGVVRSKEMALRSALGASRWRNIRQLLMENLLLAAVGSGTGFLAGIGATKMLNQLIPPNFPSEVQIDWRVLTFSASITVLTTLLFGLLPAWTLSGIDLNGVLKEGGARTGENRASNHLRNLMSVAQITLSLVLLIGAGLLLQSFLRLSEVELGFEPHNVLLATLQRPRSTAGSGANPNAGFFTDVLDRVRSLPGVEGAAATVQYPMMGAAMPWSSTTILSVPGSGEMPLPQAVPVTIIDPEYFRVMKIRLLKGRDFSERDNSGAPLVTVINEALARLLFQGQDPLGRRVKFPAARDWMQVVGVVADTRNSALEREPMPEMYVPFVQTPTVRMTVVVRARNQPEALATPIRDAVQQVDKEQPVLTVSTMDDVIADELAPRQFRMRLVGLFALLAVGLAAVGIYGVISYSVTRRRREFGLRMALGAPPSYILKLVARQGALLTGIGLVLGVAGALGLSQVMSSLLYGVNPRDPLTFTAVTVILSAIALAATYVPAYRAAKVDPVVALRHE